MTSEVLRDKLVTFVENDAESTITTSIKHCLAHSTVKSNANGAINFLNAIVLLDS